eukprot:12914048-Prorocentrum_lima.AAC.1
MGVAEDGGDDVTLDHVEQTYLDPRFVFRSCPGLLHCRCPTPSKGIATLVTTVSWQRWRPPPPCPTLCYARNLQ